MQKHLDPADFSGIKVFFFSVISDYWEMVQGSKAPMA